MFTVARSPQINGRQMVDVNLDETDFELLRRLDREGDIDVEATSEELDVSPSTVYYRLENYREMGILNGTVADLDARKLGLELTAITEIESSYGPEYEEIADELTDLSGVQNVYFMLGEMSFYVISKVKDHDHLQQLVDNIISIDGVENSVTNVVLRSFKDEPRLLVNYDDEDLTELFGSAARGPPTPRRRRPDTPRGGRRCGPARGGGACRGSA
ncbi:Lrp/AsnC family transcriptional regulator [Halorussus caseinilyticus]|uniref:Lrp/AsnC family transcriptional regulator n=2 Tax=Halorussus caseinilyticus TaxID=3034025 RepID=A0ABD5WRG8_9EURY